MSPIDDPLSSHSEIASLAQSPFSPEQVRHRAEQFAKLQNSIRKAVTINRLKRTPKAADGRQNQRFHEVERLERSKKESEENELLQPAPLPPPLTSRVPSTTAEHTDEQGGISTDADAPNGPVVEPEAESSTDLSTTAETTALPQPSITQEEKVLHEEDTTSSESTFQLTETVRETNPVAAVTFPKLAPTKTTQDEITKLDDEVTPNIQSETTSTTSDFSKPILPEEPVATVDTQLISEHPWEPATDRDSDSLQPVNSTSNHVPDIFNSDVSDASNPVPKFADTFRNNPNQITDSDILQRDNLQYGQGGTLDDVTLKSTTTNPPQTARSRKAQRTDVRCVNTACQCTIS